MHASIASWAKRCYFAGRAVMEDALRVPGLGATQWYVLHQLATVGPTKQRDLGKKLQVERATLSAVVGALAAKKLVEQVQDTVDLRQKLLRLTRAGENLWGELPDLSFIHEAAFGGVSETDAATVVRVLRIATERLNQISEGG
jgi:DNA-binding MarR family transcriptional regulator